MTRRRWVLLPLLALLCAFCFATSALALEVTHEFVPGEVLIKYRPGVQALEQASLKSAMGAITLKKFAFIGVEHLKLGVGMTVEEAIRLYQNDPRVQYVEPNYIVRASVIPNDPRFPEMYGLHNTGQTGGTPGDDIHAVNAWDVFTGDPNLLIGSIDTGIDYTHPDLINNIWTNTGEIPGDGIDNDGNGYVDDVHGYDFSNNDGDPFDDNGHGTHTSGTIVAEGNNGTGTVGVAWHGKIAAIKFLNAGGSGTTAGAVAAIQYSIVIGCKVTNNSWGGGGFDQSLLDAINAFGASGGLFCAAAGNSGVDTDLSPNYPSAYNTPYIIAVAATDNNDNLASFSNWGHNTVDLGAPGVDVLSTFPGASYGLLSGTSMATPHVTGTVALAMGRFPNATNLQIKQLIMNAAEPRTSLAGRTVTGGRLNAFLAIADRDTIPPGMVSDLAASNPGSNTMDLDWTATGDDNDVGRASSYDIRFATFPITEGNFDSATPVAGPTPQTAGSHEHFTLTGLYYSTGYYFALKVSDEFSNRGPLSNNATGTTLGAPTAHADPASFSSTLTTGASETQTLTLSNIGLGTLDFTIPSPAVASSLPHTQPYVPYAKGDPGPSNPPVTEARGGPDAFGYRWVDSDEPGGPAFNWVDITAIGTQLALTGDDVIQTGVPIGFSFPFYGTSSATLNVCTNGFLSLTDTAVPFSNQGLPNAGAPANLIAPMWDDMDFGTTPRVWTYNDGSRFILEYLNVPHYGGGGPYTFEVLLYPSGEIRYQYLNIGSPDNSATIGIQNLARTIGLQVAFNATYLHNNLAVQINSIPQWLTATPTSGRILAGHNMILNVHFDAAGLQGGLHEGAVHILNNDPTQTDLALPAHLHVLGAPNIAVNPTAVDFGTVFVGTHPTRTVVVSNIGTDQLNVTGTTSTDPTLVPNPVSFSLAPGGTQNVVLTWSPTAPSTLNANVTIASNDPNTPNKVVTAVGTAAPPPSVSVDPDSFYVQLLTNTSTSRTLHISNTGGSDFLFTTETLIASGASVMRHGDGDNVSIGKGQPDVQHGPTPLRAGGPDGFGYTYKDSDEPGGPGFTWEDIRPVGTLINLTGDDAQDGTLPIGFTFPFYGNSFTNFHICTNGWVSFTNSALVSYSNTAIPNNGAGVPENLLAVFWDDLYFLPSSHAYYFSDANHSVIQFQDVATFADRNDVNSFEIILYPTGRIAYQYLSMTASALNSATVGIQNQTRNDGLQVVFNAPYVRSALAIRFDPPARWLTVAPPSGTVPAGGHLDLNVGFNAAGLFGATYNGRVHVHGNDPIQPDKYVGCRLDVTGVPDINLVPDSLQYGPVFIGVSHSLPLQVQNTGTDSLRISSISSSDPAYVPDQIKLTVGPLASTTLNVTFTPTAVGFDNATLTFASNDPDENPAFVTLLGSGAQPPNMNVAPSQLRAALATSLGPLALTKTEPLVIRNLGGSDLVWSAQAISGASVATTNPPLNAERAKGDMGPPGALGSGGPDAAGYRWIDSDAPGGPAFSWIDISTVGTPAGLNGDDQYVAVPLPFSFPFYGGNFGALNVCSNGFASFTSTLVTYTNAPLPNAGAAVPENLLAPFWDDQNFLPSVGNGQSFYYYDGSRFIVEWKDVPHYLGGGPYTYELILYPSGAIEYQYLSMGDPTNSATIGIQDGTKTIGLQVVFDAAYVHDNLKIRIVQRPAWLGVSPLSGVTPVGGTDSLRVSFNADQYEDGDYSGTVQIASNDPHQPQATVPCVMHVGVESAVVHFSPNALSAALTGSVDVLVEDAAFVGPTSSFVNRAAVGALHSFTSPEADFRFKVLDVLPVVGSGKGVHVEVIGQDGERTWYMGNDIIKVIKPVMIGPIPMHAYASGLPTASLEAGAGIVLQWQDPTGVTVDHYQLWYSANGGANWSRVADNLTDHRTVWFVPAEDTRNGMIELVAMNGTTVVGSWLSDPFVIGHGVTSVPSDLPDHVALAMAGSNPMRGATQFELALPTAGRVEVRIHDLRGGLVRTLARGEFTAGRHSLGWDGRDASGAPVHSGVFFVRALAGGKILNLRVVMLR